ncbi:DUF6320 domain-containing protein [Fusibacter ferrireducens]|uniref:Zinc ribbon domain-containing protein n=1 Tax=Fusibacter ferrireducens TaxID=2785058 RepID=A0ABR9ZMY8_9FIRM|nr:DUF6320 domain-containing protein [Fusibacter ferrireducens]MBF4691842.1 hypothetical protein [Fusibacter ferrireducens]
MAFCSKCGVKLEDHIAVCPLCQYKVPDDLIQTENTQKAFPEALNTHARQSYATKNKIFYTYFMISIAAMSILIVLHSLIRPTHRIFQYAVICIIASVIVLFLLLGYIKRVDRIFLGLGLMTLFLTSMLDSIDANMTWSLTYALPIIVFSTAVSMIVAKKYAKSAHTNHFIFIPVYICVTLAILLPFVEIVIALNIIHRVHLSWSLISTISLLAFSGIVAGLYYQMPEYIKERLIRLFHV